MSLLIFLNLTQNYFLIDLFFSTKKNFFCAQEISTENSCDHWNLFLCCLLYKFFIIFLFHNYFTCAMREQNDLARLKLHEELKMKFEATWNFKTSWNDVENEFKRERICVCSVREEKIFIHSIETTSVRHNLCIKIYI